jgi:NADH pyrophosphatase NudC (nudix superfamily)
MFDRVTALEIIDRAYNEQRFCAACGAPNVLRNDGEAVILECSELGGAGILARIGDFLMPHTRHLVIDFAQEIAA